MPVISVILPLSFSDSLFLVIVVLTEVVCFCMFLFLSFYVSMCLFVCVLAGSLLYVFKIIAVFQNVRLCMSVSSVVIICFYFSTDLHESVSLSPSFSVLNLLRCRHIPMLKPFKSISVYYVYCVSLFLQLPMSLFLSLFPSLFLSHFPHLLSFLFTRSLLFSLSLFPSLFCLYPEVNLSQFKCLYRYVMKSVYYCVCTIILSYFSFIQNS